MTADGSAETRAAGSTPLRYNPIMVSVSAEDAVNVLVDDYRTRCLWFLRDDFYPMSREARLRVLDYVQRHGDQDAFVRE